MLVITANTLRQQLTNTEGEYCRLGGVGEVGVYVIPITAVVAIYGIKSKP